MYVCVYLLISRNRVPTYYEKIKFLLLTKYINTFNKTCQKTKHNVLFFKLVCNKILTELENRTSK